MKKVIFAIALFAVSWAANAVQVALVSHNQTSSSGTISTLINDGSQINNAAGPSTAVFSWDGTTLTSTGLYTAVSSIGSSPTSGSVLGDNVTNLTIDTSTSTASAAGYFCTEGNFLSTVGASGCGGYNLGTNFADESTTIWGPGTAVSQTLGGDDTASGTVRTIAAYDFQLMSYDGTTLVIGNGIAVGSHGGPSGSGAGGEAMTFQVVPVPAAVWLFGSALGLLGWVRRRVAQ